MKGFRVFIGCIPGDSSENELANLLSQYVNIKKVNLAISSNQLSTRYCLGYGFVVCSSMNDKMMLLSLNSTIYYRNRQITLVEYKTGKKLKEDKEGFSFRRLYVGNIPSHVSNQYLHLVFGKFGKVEAVYSVDQSARGVLKFGYVVFVSIESASLALKHKNEIFVDGALLRIEYFNGKKQSDSNTTQEQNDKTLTDQGTGLQVDQSKGHKSLFNHEGSYSNKDEFNSLESVYHGDNYECVCNQPQIGCYYCSIDPSANCQECGCTKPTIKNPIRYISKNRGPFSNDFGTNLDGKKHSTGINERKGLKNLARAGLIDPSTSHRTNEKTMNMVNENTSKKQEEKFWVPGWFEPISPGLGEFHISSNPFNHKMSRSIECNHTEANIKINRQKRFKTFKRFSLMKQTKSQIEKDLL